MNDSKHRAIIFAPSSGLSKERRKKAEELVINRGYIPYQNIDLFVESVKSTIGSEEEANGSLFLIGTSLVLMSLCQAVWLPKEWNDDRMLLDVYLFAFRHGMTIITEK